MPFKSQEFALTATTMTTEEFTSGGPAPQLDDNDNVEHGVIKEETADENEPAARSQEGAKRLNTDEIDDILTQMQGEEEEPRERMPPVRRCKSHVATREEVMYAQFYGDRINGIPDDRHINDQLANGGMIWESLRADKIQNIMSSSWDTMRFRLLHHKPKDLYMVQRMQQAYLERIFLSMLDSTNRNSDRDYVLELIERSVSAEKRRAIFNMVHQ